MEKSVQCVDNFGKIAVLPEISGNMPVENFFGTAFFKRAQKTEKYKEKMSREKVNFHL